MLKGHAFLREVGEDWFQPKVSRSGVEMRTLAELIPNFPSTAYRRGLQSIGEGTEARCVSPNTCRFELSSFAKLCRFAKQFESPSTSR